MDSKDRLLDQMKELRMWFNCWYEQSWNDNQASHYPEIIEIKKILLNMEKEIHKLMDKKEINQWED